MRLTIPAGLALLALAACSKPAAPSGEAVAPSAAPSEAAPPVLTDAQKKTLLAELPAAYQSADLANGEAKFAICKTCHTVVQGGGVMTGPNLFGIFGRKAGTSPGFAYSDGLKTLGITWDADRINQWIANPRAMVPVTKMTYIGMENPKDRTDLVAYLKTVTSPTPSAG
ncbi:MAG TPA: cytochrome c family protein [Caulobacteraceae bacterium]|jgi:cytochrome c